jgi:drug/metabolite transporter (DMT)-like permease
MADKTGARQTGALAVRTAEQGSVRAGHGSSENVPRGILCMIAATFLFSVAFAFSKWLVGIYPPGEVVFLRSFSSFAVCAAVMLPITGFGVFATRRPRDHLMRGLSQAISQTFSILAFSLMPLAGAVAINFSAPLFSALVSIVWLRERATFARWAALLVGFFGVLVVTNPGANTLTLGALFALGNVMYGSVTVAVRGMTKTESANTLLIWQMTVTAVLQSLLLLFGWRTPTLVDTAMLFASGFANVIGQYFWTQSLRLAPAMAVSPFYYLMLVWALFFGFLVWGDVPSLGLLIGSAIVVASGLFLLWRETQLQRAVTAITLTRPKAPVNKPEDQ